ncbi:MAG: hypothetical protein ABMB14_18745 [Myxococcota bacterium]
MSPRHALLAVVLVGCKGGDRVIVAHPVVTTTTTLTGTTPPGTTPPTTSPNTTTTSTTFTIPPPDPNGPQLDDVAITEGASTLDVTFAVSPGDAEVSGGTVLVDFDGVGVVLAIPDDLASWDGVTGAFALDRPTVGGCAVGTDHDVEVSVLDSAGLASGSIVTLLGTTDVGVIVDEVGESLASVLGLVTVGTMICGDLDSTGNNGTDFTADLDFALFELDPTRTWDIGLAWDTIADFDVRLFEADNDNVLTPIGAAGSPDVHGPEALWIHLTRNQRYAFEVAGWSGDPGDWTVTFD